ncbi:GNAT family N-acetyltransferase [Halobaculum lipolyticum]|uniref:GNAT family N-acetyltransferase n=1 Tax=Halobaculum lipolyticum TaxID=3032001 RepID=A0ABD5WEM9_9EURY|nr:GNAT family N-acetyltransferase [Halobaculum sp. DT31]
MTPDGADGDGRPGERVVVDRGTIEDVDATAELWVDLARDQRAHGSHLLAAPNRESAGDAVAHAVVTGGLLVARATDRGGGGDRTADGRDVVGFVTFGRESGRYRQDVERGSVYNLYVREAYRDAGVGSRLLHGAERALAETGADLVSLEAMAGNLDARRFYERHGYHEHRVEMEKSLEAVGNDSD